MKANLNSRGKKEAHSSYRGKSDERRKDWGLY